MKKQMLYLVVVLGVIAFDASCLFGSWLAIVGRSAILTNHAAASAVGVSATVAVVVVCLLASLLSVLGTLWGLRILEVVGEE